MGLAYNTVYHLYQILRHAIIITDSDNGSFSGEIEMDESYFGGRRKGNRGRGAAGKVPVFGILERGGKVKVEVVGDVKGDTLLELAIKKVKRGSLIYTDRFRSYNGLVSYGFKHRRIDHGKKFANGKVYINGIEGFWSFAEERLMKLLRRNAQLHAKRWKGVSPPPLWLPRYDNSRTGTTSSSLSAGAAWGDMHCPSFIRTSILNFISMEKELP